MIIMKLPSTMVIILLYMIGGGCSKMIQDLMNCHVNDALDHMNKSEHCTHSIIIYPDLDTFMDKDRGELFPLSSTPL
jgi:hypothetical protein